MRKKGDTGSALQKAMAILEVIAAEIHSIGVPDIAARLGLPRQSVHRIVRQMLAERLLRVDLSRERYGIGDRMEALSIDVLYSTFRRGPAHAILDELVNGIGETCTIGVLDGHEVISLDRIECGESFRAHLQVGSRLPAHATALGKVLIAHLPPNGRRRFIAAAPLKPCTDATITDAKRLEDEINLIRQRGYALSDGEFVRGLVAAAVPVIVDDGRVVAALGTNAPAARKDLIAIEQCVPQLQAAATKVQKIYTLREVRG
jgi:DNA-binding IclR family transcriptional regulator